MMQHLRQEIQLFANDEAGETGHPRLWLSSGTSRAQEVAAHTVPYDPTAYIAKLPWRQPTPTERRMLWRHTLPRDWSKCIGIVRIPEMVLGPMHRLGLCDITSKQDILQLAQDPHYAEAVSDIHTYVKSVSRPGAEPRLTGLAYNAPELPTVTFNSETQSHIGLHVDSWDRLPLDRRHEATNRISINLGREDRYLLFINLTLRTVLECLANGARPFSPIQVGWKRMWRRLLKTRQKSQPHAIPTGATAAGQTLMQRYPAYPVVKIRVAPGEAYIAPTENMIHDASTLAKRAPDLHLTFLGHLGPGLTTVGNTLPGAGDSEAGDILH